MATSTEDKLQPVIDDRGFFGHPKGLSVLFSAAMWERFGFYGMRAILTLYMVYELGYPKGGYAYAVYGAYCALAYAFPVLGGWLANQWLGYRRSILWGGVLMTIGYFAMSVPYEWAFYLAMALLSVGNGFFRPNVASIVGRLYKEGDPRRDRGFIIFYAGINIGALSAPLICGWLGEEVSWPLGFRLAGVGMLIGLAWFWFGQRHIRHHGEPDHPALLHAPVLFRLNRFHLVILGSLVLVPLAAWTLYIPKIATYLVQGMSLLGLLALIMLTQQQQGVARYRMIALIMLMFFNMLFWAGFEQAGSSFNVMAKDHLRRDIFGVEIAAAVFQSVNPLFLILFAPVFTVIWKRLSDLGREPSIPVKFSLALFQLGLGFAVLAYGVTTADGNARISMWYMVLCYLLHTMGELCLSPIGLSAVTKLAPQKWVGFCMGAWFLTIANGHIMAAGIAMLTGRGAAAGEVATVESLQNYTLIFEQVFYLACGAGIVLLFLSPAIKKLMQGVN